MLLNFIIIFLIFNLVCKLNLSNKIHIVYLTNEIEGGIKKAYYIQIRYINEYQLMRFFPSKVLEMRLFDYFYKVSSGLRKNKLFHIKNRTYVTICDVKDKKRGYENFMVDKFKIAYKKEYDKKPDKDSLRDFEKFIWQEQRHIQTMDLERMGDKEFLAYVFFHTSKPKDVKMVNGEIMEIKKIGEESHTGYNGVNEKPLIMLLTEEEITDNYKDVTDERLHELKMTREGKKRESIELFDQLIKQDKPEGINRVGESKELKDLNELMSEWNENLLDEITKDKPPID